MTVEQIFDVIYDRCGGGPSDNNYDPELLEVISVLEDFIKDKNLYDCVLDLGEDV